MAGPVASFYAQVGINTRLQDLRKVDRYLKLLERKLERFGKLSGKTMGMRLNSFKVDRKALTKELQSSLDRASRDVTLQITRFSFDQRRLQAAFSRASAGGVLAPRAGGNTYINNKVLGRDEWDRREAEKQRLWWERRNALREDEARRAAERASRPRAGNFSYSSMFHGGGIAGSIARYGMGSLPFIGGAYGLMGLNRGSQELQANAMTLSASLPAEADANKYAEFLNNLGDRLGKKTSTMTPFFAQMLAGSKGTALEPHLMSGFESLMEYSSVMMLDDQKVKGTIRAFTQMIGKQQIMAEELRGQAAEHLPPIVRLMADVAAGGDTKKLNKMMEMGQLDPNVHLPLLFARLKEEAEPLLPKYFKTSVFAQGFMGKKFEDLLKTFGEKGGDEGFARFFKMVGDAASKLAPVVEALGRAFNWLTKQLEAPLLVLGDLGTHFENLQTTMNALHPDAMKFAAVGTLLMTSWGRLAAVFSGVFLVLEDISAGVLGYDSYTKDFFTFLEKFVEFDKGIMGVAMAFLAVAGALKIAGAVAKGSMLGSILRDSLPGGTPDIPGKGKPTSPGAGWMRMLGGPLVALASYWGMNQEEFKARYNQDYDFQEEVNRFGERLVGPAFSGMQDLLMPWRQREGQSGIGYTPSDGSDIPSVPTGPEQAMSQMGMTNSTSNTITNTFEIKIDGVIDPANMENIFNQEILPQIEGWWTNQLGEVDISYGSK